jgi:hypothetical protein
MKERTAYQFEEKKIKGIQNVLNLNHIPTK